MTPRPEGVRAMRGILAGLAISAPIWGLIATAVIWSLP